MINFPIRIQCLSPVSICVPTLVHNSHASLSINYMHIHPPSVDTNVLNSNQDLQYIGYYTPCILATCACRPCLPNCNVVTIVFAPNYINIFRNFLVLFLSKSMRPAAKESEFFKICFTFCSLSEKLHNSKKIFIFMCLCDTQLLPDIIISIFSRTV
jgi:hypothetical protein